MKKLNKVEIEQLNRLNNKLIVIEKYIYDICLKHHQSAIQKILKKEDGILDYEMEVYYLFYGDTYVKKSDEEDSEYLLADWSEAIKPILLRDDKWHGINDGNDHNTTSVFQKQESLNVQKHCWLLHSLYDHQGLSWEDIFKIDSVYFDVKIQYEYESKISL